MPCRYPQILQRRRPARPDVERLKGRLHLSDGGIALRFPARYNAYVEVVP